MENKAVSSVKKDLLEGPRTREGNVLFPFLVVVLVFFSVSNSSGSARAAERDENYFPCPFFQEKPKGGEWGYIDKTGKVIIKPQFARADLFHEGMAAVSKTREGTCGYIDLKGRMVIKPRFDDAHEFKDGRAVVNVHGKYGYIDRTGRYIVEPQFERAVGFSEGLAAVRFDSRSAGYIDREGRVVMRWYSVHVPPPRKEPNKNRPGNKRGDSDKPARVWVELGFSRVASFSEGFATIRIDGKTGYIDKTGRMRIEPQFELAEAFHDGMAGVRRNGKWGFIDKTGAVVVAPQFDDVDYFSEGLASVNPIGLVSGCTTSCKWGYVDKTGRMVIEPRYVWTGRFSRGLAAVKENDHTLLYIDPTGKTVITVDAEFGYDGWGKGFGKDGVAEICTDRAGQCWSGCGFIDRTGTLVLKYKTCGGL